jgi:hypothetical protein
MIHSIAFMPPAAFGASSPSHGAATVIWWEVLPLIAAASVAVFCLGWRQ